MNGNDLLRKAQNALRLGDHKAAVRLFAQLVQANPTSEEAWLGLGLAVEDKEKRVYCLKRVAALNPENQAARRELELLEPAPLPDAQISPEMIPDEEESLPNGDLGAPTADSDKKPSRKFPSRSRPINWVLWIGMLLVGVILLVAIFGPAWSPHNPMEEHYTLRVDGKIKSPPYPAFKVEGFPLGTDNFGRDLWSRILWGVRPTMIMVAAVAAFRLVVGTLLGLVIGWSGGRMKRFMDSVLSTALSIPVLIVAIIGIYLVGIENGVLAFIIGLGLTGWAETARLVSEQTRLIKGQVFIDAVRSMGASDWYILFVHVLRHILPLLWMLLAFEMSSTLLISAELGFLGYYIGGGVYVEVSDFVAVNIAGLPELGQMLGNALFKLTDPSALIVVGSIIFLGVLGFNLLGEGLRRETAVEGLTNRFLFGLIPKNWGYWMENKVFHPISDWIASHRRLSWTAGALLVLAVGALAAGKIFYIPEMNTEGATLAVPGGHLWASERHDPFGTKWAPASIDSAPEVVWSLPIPGGPAGGPAVNAEGVVYIAGLEQVLLAIDPAGSILWQAPLEASPVGGPALDAEGNIYVADHEGGVTAFSPDGTQLWHTQASTVREATAGPIVSEAGTIYVTIIDAIAALSPEGELIWRVNAADVYAEIPPRLSARQDMVFLLNSALSSVSGTKQDLQIVPESQLVYNDPAFFTGADGLDYYRVGHAVMDWHLTETGAEAGESRTWLYQSSVLFNPADQGVTPSGLVWFYYSTDFTDSRMVWLNEERVVGNYLFPRTGATLIGLGSQDEAYLCGATGAKVECIAVAVNLQEPTWSIMLEVATNVAGGALVPGRLYVALEGDNLYALEPAK